MAKPLVVIFLGRSGCGKGTQAEMLREKYGLEYFGSGDSLRERVKSGGFSGKKIGETMNSGEFVPVVIIFPICLAELEEYKDKKPNLQGIIFDGSPRRLLEAQLLDQALEWYEWDKNIKVFLIDISEDEALNRLTKRRICKNCGKLIPYVGQYKDLTKCDECGGELMTRADDTESSIRGRLDEFRKETEPVIQYYKDKGLLIKINGEQEIEKVHQDILSALK